MTTALLSFPHIPKRWLTVTYIQSYDNSDDSISYYYSLDGSAPQFITKLTAADHSPLGQGFFDVSTGNKWGQPNNQDAVWIQYKKWGDGGFPADWNKQGCYCCNKR